MKEDDIKGKIYNKITNILPQYITTNLQNTNPIKIKYFEGNRYNIFRNNITDLEFARKNNAKYI